MTRITNRNRIVVTNGYDVLGRLTLRATLDANGNLSNTVSTTYTTVGVTNTTDELGRQTWFVHDAAGRILFQTNANNEVLKFTYNAADQMLSFKDGRNKETKWNYDEYGRVTNKLDATATAIFRYKYDPLNRLTNRWTPAKGDTFYRYDSLGNLTNVDYTGSTFDLSFQYDGLSRLTNVVDAVGNTRFGYNSFGQLTSEDGPWGGDVVSYTYNNRLRSGLSLLRASSSPWTVDYVYDGLHRLTNVISAAGGFIHKYRTISSGLSDQLAALGLGGTTHYTHTNYVEYDYDALARLTATRMLNSSGGILNQHGYQLNEAGQRTRQTVDWGDFYGSNRRWDYTYDNVGQLKSAKGTDRTWDHTYWTYNDTSRLHEQFGYGYDAAGNLLWRTNNALVQSLSVDDNNQLTSGSRSGTLTVSGWANQNRGGDESWGTPAGVTNVTVSGTGLSTGSATLYIDGSWAQAGATLANGNNSYTATARDTSERTATDSLTVNLPSTVSFQYDGNGNLTNDGRRAFGYDYENQLTDVTVSGEWRSEFQYDAFGRRRVCREYTWRGSQWGLTNELRYIYDGMVVVEERDGLNVPRVSYTRGNDLSGSFEGAGGIGGLLARTDYLSAKPVTSYYHSDGNGNVTALASGLGKIAARYHYDPYGNLLGKFGHLADLNLYRFSSKEVHTSSGLYYYGYRYYEPNLQRWLSRDPIGEDGGINLYGFVLNNPVNGYDPLGLHPSPWCDEYRETGNQCTWHEICESVQDFAQRINDFLNPEPPEGFMYGAMPSVRPGSYSIKFKSGKEYIGKGPPKRSTISAAREAKLNKDTVKEIKWKPAKSELDAFIQEARAIRKAGGLGPKLYNRINSPGEKHLARGPVSCIK